MCLADSSESLDPSHFSEVELGLSMTVSACMRSMPGLFLFSKLRESVGLHVIAGGRFWCPWTRVLPDYGSPSSGVYPDDQFCGIFPANSITVRRK